MVFTEEGREEALSLIKVPFFFFLLLLLLLLLPSSFFILNSVETFLLPRVLLEYLQM